MGAVGNGDVLRHPDHGQAAPAIHVELEEPAAAVADQPVELAPDQDAGLEAVRVGRRRDDLAPISGIRVLDGRAENPLEDGVGYQDESESEGGGAGGGGAAGGGIIIVPEDGAVVDCDVAVDGELRREVDGGPAAGDGVPDDGGGAGLEEGEAVAAAEEGALAGAGEARRGDAVGCAQGGVKTCRRGLCRLPSKLWEKNPSMGGVLWWARKRRRNPGSETARHQSLLTREARGREEGSGGRRRRIIRRMSSSSGRDDAAAGGAAANAAEVGVGASVIW